MSCANLKFTIAMEDLCKLNTTYNLLTIRLEKLIIFENEPHQTKTCKKLDI